MPADFAVIGDPVGHSWSPKMHTAAYEALGLKLTYEAIHVPLEEFDEAMESLIKLGYNGVNVTLPLKFNAFGWAEVEPESLAFGAINTVDLRTRVGCNTDAPGFLDTLRQFEIEAPGPVLLLGAGGTSNALARALVGAGFEVRIYNRTPEKAEELADQVGASFTFEPDVRDASLVLNTTSAGISGPALDIAWGAARSDAIAYDVMYGAAPTIFLEDAEKAGFRAVDGRHMLVAQGARSFEWWLGVPAPRDIMLRSIQ